MILHSRVSLPDADIEAALGVLRSGQINESDTTRQLEKSLGSALCKKYGWATANGTAAVYLALLTMGIGLGDEVLIPTYVCDDVLSAVLQVGATPVPMDVDITDLNPCPIDARRRISSRTKAIIVAHILGRPARLREFMSLGVPVIEDCAHGLGGMVGSVPAGSLGHVTTLSFHALKMLNGGEGGMVLTNNTDMASRYERLCCPNYANREWKLRSRLPNVVAAICLSQLARFPQTLTRRRQISQTYQNCAREWSKAHAVIVDSDDGRLSSAYRFALVTDGSIPYEEVAKKFEAGGVSVRRPVKNLCHRALRLPCQQYPNAESVFDRIVSLPLYPSLTREEVECVSTVACNEFA